LDLPELKLVENRLHGLSKGHEKYLQAINQYVFGLEGKRIRPLLVLLSSDIYRANLKVRIDIAVAAELVHTASLLHDDVVDAATLRRGKASVNRRWGNPTSVLAGDFLFAQAFSILSNYPQALELMTNAISTMCEGELIQLHAHFDPDITPETYVRTIASKTASLLAASCQCGGLISTMPPQQVKILGKFGLHLGTAYQIIDDIGDYSLESWQSGKPQGTDIKNGIVTLPLLYLLADPSSRGRVEQLLRGEDPITPQMLAPELAETKALERATQVAQHHLQACQEQLRKHLPHCRSILRLTGLAQQLEQRCSQLSDYFPAPQVAGHAFQHSRPVTGFAHQTGGGPS